MYTRAWSTRAESRGGTVPSRLIDPRAEDAVGELAPSTAQRAREEEVGPLAAAWSTAFFSAAVLALVATPVLRRLALASDFMDHPGDRKVHHRPMPYLGGAAIIAGALGGLILGDRIDARVGVTVFGACVVGALGMFDDRHSLDAGVRLIAQIGVAALAVAFGVRLGVTGTPAIDIVITIVWIVGITNAFNLLDNMDGLAGGTAAVTAVAVFALAALGGQDVIAALTAGLAGACIGFLSYNLRPANVYMGDSGSLFLGFTLAVATLELRPAIVAPASLAVPMILLTIPILDTTTVTLARLRHGRPVSQGGKDHLSHRLVARGLSPGVAVAILVTVQMACGAIGVLMGRSVLSPWWACGAVIALVGVVVAATAGAAVYPEPAVGLPRRLLLVVAFAVVGVLAVGAPASAALLDARDSLNEGARLARLGLRYAERGERGRAAGAFDRSTREFERARDQLGGPVVSAGLVVPGLGANVRVARTVTALGSRLSRSGSHLVRAVDPNALRIRQGQVPIKELGRVAPDLARGARTLRTSLNAVEAINQAYLTPQVRSAVETLRDRLVRASRGADQAAEGAQLIPAIVGSDGPRRYFLAVQNNAESRATGGFIGNWGVLDADRGRLHLERFRRIAELNQSDGRPRELHASEEFARRYGRFDVAHTWQNVNMSPDFPTDARVMTDLYAQSGNPPVDGVVSVDPPGLAAILELTGPVNVSSWPVPITSTNVVDVTLRQAYERFSRDTRTEFLGDVADAVWKAFTTRDLPKPADLTRVLGLAARQGHLTLFSTREPEEDLFDRVHVSARIRAPRGDGLMVVSQNAAANKVDYYLHRTVDLAISVDPTASGAHGGTLPAESAVVTSQLRLALANHAPAGGLSNTAIGPYSSAFHAGENRTYLSVYSPLDFQSAELDGKPFELESDRELGRHVYSQYVSIGPKSQRSLMLRMQGVVPLAPGGWYALELNHQALLNRDSVKVSVSVPSGWRIAETVGLGTARGARAFGTFHLNRARTVLVRVERTGVAGFWDRLRT